VCEKGPSVSAESTAKKNTLSSKEGKGVVNKGSRNQSSSPRKYDHLLVRFSDSWIILLSPAFPPSPATAVAYSGRFRPHLQLRGSDGFSPSFLYRALLHGQDYDLSEGIPNVNGFFSMLRDDRYYSINRISETLGRIALRPCQTNNICSNFLIYACSPAPATMIPVLSQDKRNEESLTSNPPCPFEAPRSMKM